MSWHVIAAGRIERGEVLALVTVCAVKGSAPREAGAKMLVWPNAKDKGGQEGSIGGGQLEFTLVEQARKMLAAGAPWRFQNYPLGPLLGQCCGGNVAILLERLDRASLPWLAAMESMEIAGVSCTLISRLDADGIAKQVAVADQGADGVAVRHSRSGDPVRSIGEGAIVTEHVNPAPPLLMFGAGHVGQALAPIAATLPFRCSWFDTRAAFARSGVTITSDPAAAIEAAPSRGFFLIFTHSHALDYDLTRAVLGRGDFSYCGLIGSATKRARFETRLAADGIAPAMLARLTCPIGDIGLASKLPQAIAVAVAAELLLARQAALQAAAKPRKAVHAT